MIDISIIIVNYNVKEYIIPCIESIFQLYSKKLAIEIIVVDNKSIDGSANAIKNKFPKIKLIINDSNIGFSKGINQGAKYASGKYYFILNPDTYFLNDSLTILYKYMEKNKTLAAVGPSMLSTTLKHQQSYWRKTTLFTTLLSLSHLDFLNLYKNYKGDLFTIPTEVESISGGAFFVNSFVFNSLNGFDPNLFWMEDIDFCLRAANKGYKIYFLPSAKIVHHQGKSVQKNYKIATINQLISKTLYFKKHHNKLSFILLNLFILTVSILKSIILIIISPFHIKYRQKLSGYLLVVSKILFNY